MLKNQRMVLSRPRGNLTFQAWTVSIVLHLIALTVFSFVTLSKPKAYSDTGSVPTAKVNKIREFMQSAAVLPKPKVKRASVAALEKKPKRLLTSEAIFGNSNSDSDVFSVSAKPQSFWSKSLAEGLYLPAEVSFFGSKTRERKICYVVDCSGSMQGMLGRLRENLKESVSSLEEDQFFYIIFFGDGRLFEIGDGRMIRATGQAKKAAYDFIDDVRAAGQTNAVEAFARAVRIGEGAGVRPSVFYFLTDGFDLIEQQGRLFSVRTAELLKQFAPEAKVNTIGFWPAKEDRKILQTIAEQSGGECILVIDDKDGVYKL